MTPPTETLENPLVIEREKKEKNALEKVAAWVVKTSEDYAALDTFLVGLADLKKMIVADFAESKEETAKAKKAATAAHKAVCDQEEGHIGIIEDARRIGKQKLADFDQVQRIKQEKLQAEADAKAKKDADDRALELAALAEKSGDTEKAEAILAEPAAPAPRIAAYVPQRSTITSTRYSATVADPQFALKSVRAALKFMEKAKTPAAVKATEDLRQAEEDMAYMVYNQVAVNKLAVAGSPYVNGVKKLGGVVFSSRTV